MKHILCYGDSNTFGANPLGGGRLSDHERWTTILGELLGDGYQVIDEGLNGRTTVFEDEISYGKNGIRTLVPCIASHNPLDLIIVMLGTNDLKPRYNVTPNDLFRAMDRVIDEIQRFSYAPDYPVPEILLVSPVLVREGVSRTYGTYNENAPEMSAHFAEEYRRVSESRRCHFFDAATVAEASDEDRLHMNAANHRQLAAALAGEVRKIIG